MVLHKTVHKISLEKRFGKNGLEKIGLTNPFVKAILS